MEHIVSKDVPINERLRWFADYLESSGPGSAADHYRCKLGAVTLARLYNSWPKDLICINMTRVDRVIKELGEPMSRTADSLIYDLGNRPGYSYSFQFDLASRMLVGSGYDRRDFRTRPTIVGGTLEYKNALIELGATKRELQEWLGQPRDWSGWWPEETWDYGQGLILRLRHGVVEPDS